MIRLSAVVAVPVTEIGIQLDVGAVVLGVLQEADLEIEVRAGWPDVALRGVLLTSDRSANGAVLRKSNEASTS